MADQEVQQQLQRLQKAREKADKLSQEKSRLTGELGALEKQIGDLESKCVADFGCSTKELPGFVSQLKEESETALCNAEIILGLREGTARKPKQATVPVSASVPTEKPMEKSPSKDEDIDAL